MPFIHNTDVSIFYAIYINIINIIFVKKDNNQFNFYSLPTFRNVESVPPIPDL